MPKKGGGAAKAAPAPAVEPAVIENWFDKLSPEEQESERKKQEGREQKALVAKKQEEKDRWYREERERETKKSDQKASREAKQYDKAFKQDKERALQEGIMEAQEYDDGLWYVDVGKGTYKHVDCGFWCSHCEASLSESTLGSHINGERHRKKLAWLQPAQGACPQAAPSTPPRAAAAAPATRGAPGLESWQEMHDDGYIRCLACNKCCDGTHEYTSGHESRLKAFLQSAEKQSSTHAYATPDQPWLAWVPCEDWGNERWLKCLMCNKWVQDHEGSSTANYVGAHGSLGSGNQKDHRKKVENLDAYMRDVTYWGEIQSERQKWHPQPNCREVPASRTARPQASADGFQSVGATPAANSSTSSAGGAAARPRPPDLPIGWYSQWSEEHHRYYFHDGAQLSCWDPPSSSPPAAPSVAAAQKKTQEANAFAALARDEEEEC